MGRILTALGVATAAFILSTASSWAGVVVPPPSVPEPAPLAILALGAAAILGLRYRRRSRK